MFSRGYHPRRPWRLLTVARPLVAAALMLATYGSTARAQRIYWTDVSGRVVQSAPEDGPYSARTEAVPTGIPTGLAVDPFDGVLYWTNATSNPPGIFKVTIGQPFTVQTVVTTPDAQDVALDLSRGHIYWIDRTSDEIERADLSSGLALNRVTVVSGNMEEPRALELDLRNGKIYWSDHDFNWIQRANLNGSARETVVSGITADLIESIALDVSPATRLVAPNGRIYWTEHTIAGGIYGSSDILQASIASPGGEVPRVALVEDAPGIIAGLAVDERARKLYWANRSGGDTIFRAELDASAAVPLIPVEGQPYAVVLDDVFCGNGVEDPNEECDDGDFDDEDGCDRACRSECGNGRVDGDEECDDGGTSVGDGCSQRCMRETGWVCPSTGGTCEPDCGDGRLVGGESCDDGSRPPVGGDGCDATCRIEPDGWRCPIPGQPCEGVCGDALQRGRETCDDGNRESCDGCSSDCIDETGCGDGVLCQNAGEECEPPGADGCDPVCLKLPYCGDASGTTQNGVCQAGAVRQRCTIDHDCDRAPDSADGVCGVVRTCTQGTIGAACVTDSDCVSGTNSGSCDLLRVCTDGQRFNRCSSDADCNLSGNDGRCYVEPCDDGNADNTDDCVLTNGQCQLPKCGDGFVHKGYETCDPPDTTKCDANCFKRTSCRERLVRLVLADNGSTTSASGRVQVCKAGDPCATNQGCSFRLGVCLVTADAKLDSDSGCQPAEMLSLELLEMDLSEGSWQRPVADQISRAVGAFGGTPIRRCSAGRRHKSCATDEDCNRSSDDTAGRCGPAALVEFSPPLRATEAAMCAQIEISVPPKKRLRLKTKGYGHLAVGNITYYSPRRDTDHIRLVCR